MKATKEQLIQRYNSLRDTYYALIEEAGDHTAKGCEVLAVKRYKEANAVKSVMDKMEAKHHISLLS